MIRSLVIALVLTTGTFAFDTPEAEAHRRWVRRPVARAVFGPPVIRRRVYHRPFVRPYVRPRVYVGVGIGGGYW